MNIMSKSNWMVLTISQLSKLLQCWTIKGECEVRKWNDIPIPNKNILYHEHMLDGVHCQHRYILSSVNNLFEISAIYIEIPCKMLAWLNKVGQAAVISCHQVCNRQCKTYPYDSTQPLADHRKVVLKKWWA